MQSDSFACLSLSMGERGGRGNAFPPPWHGGLSYPPAPAPRPSPPPRRAGEGQEAPLAPPPSPGTTAGTAAKWLPGRGPCQLPERPPLPPSSPPAHPSLLPSNPAPDFVLEQPIGGAAPFPPHPALLLPHHPSFSTLHPSFSPSLLPSLPFIPPFPPNIPPSPPPYCLVSPPSLFIPSLSLLFSPPSLLFSPSIPPSPPPFLLLPFSPPSLLLPASIPPFPMPSPKSSLFPRAGAGEISDFPPPGVNVCPSDAGPAAETAATRDRCGSASTGRGPRLGAEPRATPPGEGLGPRFLCWEG